MLLDQTFYMYHWVQLILLPWPGQVRTSDIIACISINVFDSYLEDSRGKVWIVTVIQMNFLWFTSEFVRSLDLAHLSRRKQLCRISADIAEAYFPWHPSSWRPPLPYLWFPARSELLLLFSNMAILTNQKPVQDLNIPPAPDTQLSV